MKRMLSLILAIFMMLAMGSFAVAEEEMVTISMMVSEASSQPYLQDTAPLRYIKENFGIDIQYMAIPESDYATKISTVFATNDLPDVVRGVNMNTIGSYELEDMVVNLLDYKEIMPNYFGLVDAEDRINSQKTLWQTDSEGNPALYLLQRLEYNRIDIAPIGAIRGDLLEEQGLAMPTSWDELYDVMLKIKEAHPDVYFFSSRNGTNWLLGMLNYTMGSGGYNTNKSDPMYLEPETGLWTYGPTQEYFDETVAFLAKAYADGLVDPDYATTTRDDLWEKITTGKVVYFKDNNSFLSSVFEPAFDANGHDTWYFDIIPPVANSNIEDVREIRYERDWKEGLVFSLDCPEIERVLKMFDWCYSYEGMMVTSFGIEGETYYVDETGYPMVVESIIEETRGATDHLKAVQGVLGVGTWSWTPYINEATYLQTAGPLFLEQGEEIRGYTEAGLIDYKAYTPAFTLEESEEIADIEIELQVIFESSIDAFIKGERSMDEWPELVEELKDAGSERLEEIFNEAYNR